MNSKRSKGTGVDTRIILNLLSDPVIIADQNGRFILVNDAFGKATGLNPEELIGTHFKDVPVIDSKTKAFLMEQWKKTMQGAPSVPYEVLFVTPAGEKRIVEMKARRIIYDGEPADLVILRDVTRRKEDAKRLEKYAKRMEAVVEEAEKRYYTLFNQAPIGIYLVDPETTIAVEFNDVGCRQLGYSREEFAKLRIPDYEVIKSPEELKVHIEHMKKAGGDIFETKHRTKNGDIIDVAVTARMLEIAGKKFVHLTSQNITERKKAEEKLRDSEEKLRSIIDSSPDPIVVSSADAKILDCNPAALKTFGYSTKSEVIGRNVLDFFAEKERTKAAETLARGVETARNLEYIFQAKNGREFVGELSFCSVLQSSGEIAYFVSTIRDLTERREKEKALRESEKRFKQVAKNAEEWIWEVDAQGMYTYSSPVVEKILGYKPEEIVGKKHFYDLFHPENQEQLRNKALKFFEQKRPFHGFINANMRSNGEVVWLSTSGVPILDQQGTLVGYRGVDTDITEFKKAQEALQASERNYRAIINAMNDTAWVIGFDGSFIDVNDAAVKVLGYSREELLSGGVQKIDKHLNKSEVQALIDRLPTVGTQVFETVHTSKDGKKVPVEICSSLVTYQGKQAILSIARDITERRKAEEAVRSAEHKFRNLFEKANDAYTYLDKSGRILDVNAKTIEMFGGTKEELLGKHFTKLGIFSVKNIPMLMRSFAKILRGKEVNIEVPIKSKQQQQIILECSASLLKTEESTGIIVVARDITERKKAEESIRNAEEMYRQLFNTIPSGVAVYKDVDNGKDFVFVDFNKTAEKIEKIPKQKLLGKRATKVFPGIKELGLFKVLQRVHRTGQAEFLPTGMYKDGRISGWRENWVYKLPNGAIVAVYNDVTERVKTNQKLAKDQEELNLIINSSPVLIFYKDKEGKFLRVNKAFAEALKMPQEEFVGKTVFDLYSAKIAKSMANDDMEVLQLGKPKLGIIEQYESARGVRWVQTDKVPIFDENGIPNGLIGFAQDITERVKMQKKLEKYSRHLEDTVEKRTRELKEANAKLLKAERLAAIGELAGMVGHDLRNPLTGIKNAAYYLIKKDQTLDGNSKKMLEIIDSAVSRADKIIGDLQEYSREIQLDLIRYSPKTILQEALAVVQIPTKVKIVDNVLDEPLVMADKPKMVRVFMSIVKNAVDAMPEGGTLQIKSAQKNGNLEISFADTGVGIPKEAMKKLFSPLVTTKAQGMGFGLAICKRIIDAHQGRITVQSVEGQGSTFTVTIPIEPKLKAPSEPEWINLQKAYRRRRKHKRQS